MKKFIIIFIAALLTFIFIIFYNPIVNRLSSNFNVQINNNSIVELKQINVRGSVDKDIILKTSLAKNEINKYKLTKEKLTKNSSYIIQCEVNNKIYESEIISYSEKYNFSDITILIKNGEEKTIEFAVYKKN